MDFNSFFFFEYSILKSIILFYPKIALKAKLDFLGNSFFYCYYSFSKIFSFFYWLSLSSFFRFKSCVETTIIDNLSLYTRFTLFYSFLSMSFNRRVSLFFLFYENFSCLSLCSIFYSINWLEREIFDMFGIFFINHPNLRKILTDYGFIGYPLRKDFPIIGFIEIYFSSYLQKIKYIKI